MHKYLSSSLNSVVSIDLETSWAARSLQEVLRQSRYDARFQQKQIQVREEKLLRLYENQQQRAFERVGRGSAGSNTSVGSLGSTGGSTGGGKVRQMFDERRQKAGVDRSYPLEPLGGPKSTGQLRGGSMDRLKKPTSRTVMKSTVQKTINQVRNGKPVVNKREIVQTIYNNNDGDESYEEHQFEDNNANNDTFVRPHRDIVDMMNSHNLSGGLDDEELPQIGFNEMDEPYISGKLANLGGRLPSETVAKTSEKKPLTTNGSNGFGKTFRKETKPIVKKTIRQALPLTEKSYSQPVTSVSSPPLSPARSMSQTPASAKGTPSKTQGSARVPNSSRPSAKQQPKSPVVRDDLTECKFCGRRFATDRLQVHEQICGQTSKKKRKTYDATKHRIQGTDLAPYVKKGGRTASNKPKQVPKKDWRRTHEEFINAIRAAKMAQLHVAKGGKLTDLPPPPPSSNPDYVQCPHCGRRFNESAAERHIPKCASYSFNKPKPGQPSKGKTGTSGRSFK